MEEKNSRSSEEENRGVDSNKARVEKIFRSKPNHTFWRSEESLNLHLMFIGRRKIDEQKIDLCEKST